MQVSSSGEGEVSSKIRIAYGEVDVEFFYEKLLPGHWQGGKPVITGAHSKVKNPLFRALESKAKKISRSNCTVPAGVILCDGGLDILGDPGRRLGGDRFSVNQITEELFRKYSSLSFVIFLQTPQKTYNRITFREESSRVSTRILENPNGRLPLDREDYEVLRNIASEFPPLNSDGGNARRRLNCDKPQDVRRINLITGVGRGARRRLKLSSTTLREILAGEISIEEAGRRYGDAGSISSVFSENSVSIQSVSFERGEGDDDAVIFIVDEDPNRAPFK